MEKVSWDLSRHTEEGYAYRVDLRLRPYGGSGQLISSIPSILNYYRKSADLWEVQALLKVRPVAGNLELGYRFVEEIKSLFFKDYRKGFNFCSSLTEYKTTIKESIDKMRTAEMKKYENQYFDVKSGFGGIRDIEFLVQGIQMIYANNYPEILTGNTLSALEKIKTINVIPEQILKQLEVDYIFLRKVEHYLQILEDQQIHSLPKDASELSALAKRVLGINSNADKFMFELNNCLLRVREAYKKYLMEN